MAKKTKSQTSKSTVPPHSTGAKFNSLTPEEKEEVWRFYDRPIPLSETRPLTPAERRQLKQDKMKVGRPRIGTGTKIVSLTVEKGLLAWADAYAKQHGLSRARLVAQALESLRTKASA
jgi:hypothetical protein